MKNVNRHAGPNPTIVKIVKRHTGPTKRLHGVWSCMVQHGK
jgi:hypothetical protein